MTDTALWFFDQALLYRDLGPCMECGGVATGTVINAATRPMGAYCKPCGDRHVEIASINRTLTKESP